MKKLYLGIGLLLAMGGGAIYSFPAMWLEESVERERRKQTICEEVPRIKDSELNEEGIYIIQYVKKDFDFNDSGWYYDYLYESQIALNKGKQ